MMEQTQRSALEKASESNRMLYSERSKDFGTPHIMGEVEYPGERAADEFDLLPKTPEDIFKGKFKTIPDIE